VALARSASLVTCALLLLAVRLRSKRSAVREPASKLTRMAVLWALGVAVLDTGGNLLLIAATRIGRLDIAAVLASLYPAGTILLAAWHLHERPTRRQLTGMAIAAAAVVMITI
jgi:drug/metabolite transporter (DMT)-like permease